MIRTIVFCLSLSATFAHGSSLPTEVFFTESFDSDSAQWVNIDSTSFLNHVPNGGADGGGYVTTDFNAATFSGQFNPVLFRAQDEFSSSGNAYVADYVGLGVKEVRFSVRHNAPVPVPFNIRFSGPFNFPGATAIAFAPVPGNVWTELAFAIEASSPQFVTFEGQTFGAVFGDVGHLQIGISDDALTAFDQAFAFDLDEVVILRVPEPASAALLALVLSLGAATRRAVR